MEERLYQKEAKEAILKEWRDGHKRTLLVLPTGTGKTVVFSNVLKEVIKKDEKALILAHTGELLDQAMDKIQKFGNLDSALEKAKESAVESNYPVVAGSVQTISRDKRLNLYSPDYFKYIVIDEAHHCLADSYKKILDYFKNANVLGVTATPNRGDQKKTIRLL